MSEPGDVPPEVLAQLRRVCLALPDVYEEPAWVGIRWRIRTRTFAHVLTIDRDDPPAFAKAADPDGRVTVMTFRAAGAELAALTNAGYPFFKAQWGADVVGLTFDDDVDWEEVAELLTDSYCILAPKKLAGQVQRPGA